MEHRQTFEDAEVSLHSSDTWEENVPYFAVERAMINESLHRSVTNGDQTLTHGAFIDESEKNTSHYFLGALVITQQLYWSLAEKMTVIHDQVLRDYPMLPTDFEFHGWEFMSGKKEWRGVPIRYRVGIMNKILTAVAESGGCVHIEGIDCAKHAARRYKHEFPPREIAFNYLFERIDACLITRSLIDGERPGTEIFADEHHTKAESTSNFTDYQQYGTWGYKSSKLGFLHPRMTFMDSKTTYALQAIDCVTYIYNRVKTHKETDERAQQTKNNFWTLMQPMFAGCGTHRIWP